MNQQALKDYVFHKYGLQFQSSSNAVPDHQILSLTSQPPFAVLSLTNARLAVKCPDFAKTISSLPNIELSRLVDDADWVEVGLEAIEEQDLKNLLDYAFKTTTNRNNNFVSQQLIYLPEEDEYSPYSSQQIPQRKLVSPQKQVPSRLQKMRESYDYTVFSGNQQAYNFYRQGQLMADYEEDYDQIYELRRYYPDYHAMDVHQLRTYFTWRTQLRHGDFTVSSTSYAYVYLYELLNNIGVTDPDEGYEKLQEFLDKYADAYGQRMKDYLHQWLQDYVLYYGLDRKKANTVFADKLAVDRDYHLLRHPQEYSATEITAVFAKHCPYLAKSRLYKKNPENWSKLVATIWRHVYEQAPQIFNQLIASPAFTSGYLFRGAIFYFHGGAKLREYVIDSERKYQFKQQKYYCQDWQPVKGQAKLLNTFFHEIDRLVRQKFQLGHPLKARSLDLQLLTLINEGIIQYQERREEEQHPQVEIDLNGLDQIRQDASTTRESLLTDEEIQADREEEGAVTPLAEKSTISVEPTEGLTELSADENYLLEALFKQQSYQEYLTIHHLMASILVDNINEKLFDVIGDAVIKFNEQDQPVIVEDYRQDIQELLEGRN